jgi:hypothetical protein
LHIFNPNWAKSQWCFWWRNRTGYLNLKWLYECDVRELCYVEAVLWFRCFSFPLTVWFFSPPSPLPRTSRWDHELLCIITTVCLIVTLSIFFMHDLLLDFYRLCMLYELMNSSLCCMCQDKCHWGMQCQALWPLTLVGFFIINCSSFTASNSIIGDT